MCRSGGPLNTGIKPLWSAWLFFRKRVLFQRVVGNVLIAAGAMLPAVTVCFSSMLCGKRVAQ